MLKISLLLFFGFWGLVFLANAVAAPTWFGRGLMLALTLLVAWIMFHIARMVEG